MKLQKTPAAAWYFQQFNPFLVCAGEVKVVIANKTNILSRTICRPVLQGLGDIVGQQETVEQLLWAKPLSDMILQ